MCFTGFAVYRPYDNGGCTACVGFAAYMGGVSGKDDGNTSGDYCSFGAAACADTGNLSFVLSDWEKAV